MKQLILKDNKLRLVEVNGRCAMCFVIVCGVFCVFCSVLLFLCVGHLCVFCEFVY